MAEQTAYIRRDFLPQEKPPTSDASAFGWMRKNLFARPSIAPSA